MTHFTVDWKPEILGDLANIWLNSPDRQAVTKAQAQIDRLLERDPLGVGMEVSEGLRKLHVPPLEVLYTVEEDRHLVDIEDLGYRP